MEGRPWSVDLLESSVQFQFILLFLLFPKEKQKPTWERKEKALSALYSLL